MEFVKGERVEIYIPTPDDPEHRYHGKTGVIVDVFEDDLSSVTGNPSRGRLYTVAFEDAELDKAEFRYDDLQRPDEY